MPRSKRKRISFVNGDPGTPPAKQCKTPAGEPKIRWRGQTWLLTYAGDRIHWTHEYIYEYLINKLKLKILMYTIGREKFTNGTNHWHVWFRLSSPLDVENEKWGWIDEISCDYKHAKDYHAEEYAMKDMDYKSNSGIDHFPTSKKYRAQRDDQLEWLDDRVAKARTELSWPIQILDLYLMNKPDPGNKKRHVCIAAPPNFGKTLFSNSLGNKNIFDISASDHPLEGYRNEDLIIIHSIQLDWYLLEWLTDTHARSMPAPGKQRYRQIKNKPGHCRNIIYLLNFIPNYGQFQSAFEARFHIFNKLPSAVSSPPPAARPSALQQEREYEEKKRMDSERDFINAMHPQNIS